jgi:LuxR family maltose regulon positive regulatory protein
MSVAWISLDKGDNDPRQFFHYLIAALQSFGASIGQSAMTMLLSPQIPPVESVVTSLIKDIMEIKKDVVLVLDDYHMIDDRQVHSIVEFLLDHLPIQMHLVMTTRVDPPLPLARLRVRNQLTEFRASDLCFSFDEATDFLNKLMNLGLSKNDISILESRTEGWIAGLQLAALSIQGRKDISEFIKSFAGDDRHIVDYLVEEVLNLQPEPVQNFLLQTSILNRLSASLCDFVTDKRDSQKILDELERTNLFIVPLDNKRHWYRYHHLFAELLKQRLQQATASFSGGGQKDIAELHKRASEWYENNGMEIEAIQHAVIAEDFGRAAALLELAWPEMDSRFQSPTWLGLVKALPDTLIRTRPVLSAGYAWAYLNEGKLEAGEDRLRDAERWLETLEDDSEQTEVLSGEMVFVDEAQFQSLPSSIAIARSYISQARGDLQGTEKYAQRALDLLPEGDHTQHGMAESLLGLTHWVKGDLETAHKVFADAMANFQIAGKIHFAVSATIGLSEIKLAQGRLHEAKRACQQSLQLAAEQDEYVLTTADLYLGLSVLCCEQGELDTAIEFLMKSNELGKQDSLPDWRYRWYLAQARIKEAQKDFDGTLDALDEANRIRFKSLLPDVRPIAALKTRVWIKQGRLSEALDWAHERGLSVEDDLSYLHEFEHITLVRLLIARYNNDGVESSIHEAIELLQCLLKAAEEGKRLGSIIEILLLQALAQQIQGNISMALDPLKRALNLAEPEGYVRIFVDEGAPIAELLEKIIDTKVDVSRVFVKKLLSLFRLNKLLKKDNDLVEALSERELEVLRFISAGLSNKKIMDELFLSLSTVKTHIRNIYSKLNVHSRTEAIVRAKELNLL